MRRGDLKGPTPGPSSRTGLESILCTFHSILVSICLHRILVSRWNSLPRATVLPSLSLFCTFSPLSGFLSPPGSDLSHPLPSSGLSSVSGSLALPSGGVGGLFPCLGDSLGLFLSLPWPRPHRVLSVLPSPRGVGWCGDGTLRRGEADAIKVFLLTVDGAPSRVWGSRIYIVPFHRPPTGANPTKDEEW